MANVRNVLSASDIHEVTTVKQGVLGQVAETADGRKYRYAKNGAVALVAGAEVQTSATAAATSTTDGKVPVAGAKVVVDDAVSAANAPKYEDGILTVASARYLVTGVTSKTIALHDKVGVAIADGVATSLAANQYCGVVVKAAGASLGFAEVAVPANAYFWAYVSA